MQEYMHPHLGQPLSYMVLPLLRPSDASLPHLTFYSTDRIQLLPYVHVALPQEDFPLLVFPNLSWQS